LTGPDHQFRAGGRVLSLFASTSHGAILRALVDGPVRLAELRARVGIPSEAGLRGNIGNLIGIGALEKRRPDGRPDLLDNQLTPLGRQLLSVASAVDEWLARGPCGPLEAESEPAREAVKALVAGWSSSMLRALAARPLSLEELCDLIASLTGSSLERRVTAMRDAGLLTTEEGDRTAPAFAVTRWLREGVAPLLAAIRCERSHLRTETAPLTRLDVETLLLLTVPLLGQGMRDGNCQITVDLEDGSRSGPAGVRVEVQDGGIVSCVSKLDDGLSDAAFGSAEAWLEALVAGTPNRLRTKGEDSLAALLVENLHDRLYPAGTTAR
jgi:DNA-binding HxlR family transcriptional regulator